MKVCFLLNDLALSGGTGVVLHHATELATRHDMDVTIVVCGGHAERWDHRGLEGATILSLDEAREQQYDVAVATWWRTAYSLFGVPARRYAYFVQSLEDRFYPNDVGERLAAAVTHALPVAFITEAQWIRDVLDQTLPGAQVHYVRNGVDKHAFVPVEQVTPAVAGPLKIVLEGHPDVWFKGIDESFDVLERLEEPFEATLITGARDVDVPDVVGRCIGPIPQAQMADEYASHHVLLKMSRVEGMYGPPLEAFHRGATVVTTPVTGHDEYVRHGWNGLVADWDDLRGTARFLDLLARDRRLLHRLRTNALITATSWPAWPQAGDAMARALRAIADAPPPEATSMASRLIADVGAGLADMRRERTTLVAELHQRHAEIEHLRGEVRKVCAQVDDYHRELTAKGDELGDLMHSRRWWLGGQAEMLLATRPGRLLRRGARSAPGRGLKRAMRLLGR